MAISYLIILTIVSYCVRNGEFAAIDKWDVPKNIKKGDTFWTNCTGHMDGLDLFAGFVFMKDSKLYYKFTNDTSAKAQSYSVPGIDKSQIEVFDRLGGSVRIKNAKQGSQGDYQCQLLFKTIDGQYSRTTRNSMVGFSMAKSNAFNINESLPKFVISCFIIISRNWFIF